MQSVCSTCARKLTSFNAAWSALGPSLQIGNVRFDGGFEGTTDSLRAPPVTDAVGVERCTIAASIVRCPMILESAFGIR